MNLGEFKSQISANIRRGTSLDALIPKFVRQGARWLERNRTMNYMKRFADLTIDPDETDTPRYIELNDTEIKSVLLFRWLNTDGSFANLRMKDPRDFTGIESGVPAFYWLNGVSTIVLSGNPDQVLTGELWIGRYTSWPTNDASTHWLMDNAEDVLEARAMMNVAAHLRDPEMREHWKARLDEGLVGLYAAEDELALENTDLRMEYYGEGAIQG